jgi:hypothetical protein
MRPISRYLSLLAFVLAAAGALAQDIGRVQFISGSADAQRGAQAVALALGSAVREGDVITTGADGHLQLEMADGARIAMRPRSTLRLERYEFNAAARESGSALLALVKGTMRVFTGAIASRDKSRFQMKTNLATVGIRGSGNILVNLDGTETLNHTLTGAHSVTSIDAQGNERTLISRPGQTVQVLPRQAPRYVPTPPLILSAASQPATARAAPAEKAAETSTTGGAAASVSTASSSSTSSGSSSSTTTASSTPAETTSASTTPATTASTPTTTTTTSPAAAEPPPAVAAASPSSPTTSTSVTTSNPSVSTSQATTGTVGSSIATSQPPAGGGSYDAFVRFFNPIGSGFEGVLGQSDPGSTAVFDSAGHLLRIDNATVSTFLAGPGALPAGYDAATFTGDITFNGGVHRDAFRSPDSSVILGRWEGGTVAVDGRSFDLGPRSASYQVVTATPAGVVGAFTGAATYSLVASTAPTDAAGRAGSLGSASITANFSSRTLSGNFALSINGQSFTLNGNAGLDPGASAFAFASALQNLSIACSGSCASQGYLGTMNGQFAGGSGRWIAMSYRLNPVRLPGTGFADFIVGSMALESGASPTIGIVLPQSGTASLVFNGVDAARSFSTFPGAGTTPSVTGTLQANFTSQTVAFNATVSGGCNCTEPTFTATASNVPIVGAGFSASTDTQRPPRVGAMAIACSGAACTGGPAAGRFDGLFRNNAGTTGIALIVLGDANGAYEVVTSFGSTAALQMSAADARAAAAITTPASPAPILAHTIGRAPARIARIQ